MANKKLPDEQQMVSHNTTKDDTESLYMKEITKDTSKTICLFAGKKTAPGSRLKTINAKCHQPKKLITHENENGKSLQNHDKAAICDHRKERK